MDNSTYNSEQILKWLDGEMTGEEKTSFEQALASNPQLKAEVESLQMAKNAIRSYGLKENVAAIHSEMMQEMQAPIRMISNRRRIIRYTISVAASILLIFIGITAYNFFSLSADKLYNQQFQSYELSTVRGTESFTPIEKLYQQKDYKAVTQAEKQLQSKTTEENFLTGMSYMELNDLNSAIPEFETVINDRTTSETSYRERAEYYLALAYLKAKNYKKAIEQMESIRNDPHHIYHDKFSNSFIRKVKMLSWR